MTRFFTIVLSMFNSFYFSGVPDVFHRPQQWSVVDLIAAPQSGENDVQCNSAGNVGKMVRWFELSVKFDQVSYHHFVSYSYALFPYILLWFRGPKAQSLKFQ